MNFLNITTIEEANIYLQSMYGLDSCIEKYHSTTNNKLRFRFINVKPIRNFPFGFKSVETAMRCLRMHENGYVAWQQEQRKQKHKSDNQVEFFK